ncbi:hypothetical protein VitviT2T_001786 [Vitis vinifera]|uniref:Protein kinase domain-containing protein n=2 Tax=Vitis vinifera TaxID=29760 RepID=A0ABY9BGI6_VITVI|eukprot:XP_003631375.1 PREDICTED: probable inactive receptor kinase At5g58300 [Vitis vinifera]
MLSRAFSKPRWSPKNGELSHKYSSMVLDQCDIVGLMEGMPLSFCDHDHRRDRSGTCMKCPAKPTLRDVLSSSVGVMGESPLAMTEKVVMYRGKRVYAVKRFRKVSLGKMEFGRRVERVAGMSRRCEYLVPLTAYLYAKRMKFVLTDYYPMGSLADLLAGGRALGHTALDWNQRLQIILHIARAIAFIHSQSPPVSHDTNKYMQMNVHGNVKSSNVMINVDFSARLSDYGFVQLVDPVEDCDTWQMKPPPPPPSPSSSSPSESFFSEKLCQKSDVYNFGIIILDTLGGPRAVGLKRCILENKEAIRDRKADFFEFSVRGKEKKQAFNVLEIGLACLDSTPEARPSIEQILHNILEVSEKA